MALFSASRNALPQGAVFQWREQSPSTNSELIALAHTESNAWPNFSVLATANQTAGRGRSGRTWQAPEGASLAISVLLRPNLQASANLNHLGWLPLLAGLAMSESVNQVFESSGVKTSAAVKWPNDVLVNEHKLTGVLTEFVGNLEGLVVGAGLNVSLTKAELPVETATSLILEGAVLPTDETERFDQLLAGYLRRLRFWYQKFENSNFDANKSGLRQAVIANCASLNREVRAIMPGDKEITGRATTIDDTGRLVLEVDGQPMPVAAGDIVHMRHN